MAARTPKPPPGPEITDRDLKPVRERDNRFDLDAEVTVKRGPGPSAPPPPVYGTQSSDSLGPALSADGLTPAQSGSELTPANTLDEPGEPISASATALFGDDEEETEAAGPTALEATHSEPTPKATRKPKPKPHRSDLVPSPLDLPSGDRVHPTRARRAPLAADAFERPEDLSGSTNRDLHTSWSVIQRFKGESLAVQIGLVAAIVSLTVFVAWLLFLAAR